MNEQVAQVVQDALARKPLRYVDRQSFTGYLIHKCWHSTWVPVGRTVSYEVVPPDMIRMNRTESNARRVVEPGPPALALPFRNVKAR